MEIDSFMYLEMLLRNKCEEEKEIVLKFFKANGCVRSLGKSTRTSRIAKHTSMPKAWIFILFFGGKRQTKNEIYEIYGEA